MRWLALVVLTACGGVGVDESVDFEAVNVGTVTFKCSEHMGEAIEWEVPDGWFSLLVGTCAEGECEYYVPRVRDGKVWFSCEKDYETKLIKYAVGVGIILNGASGTTTAPE